MNSWELNKIILIPSVQLQINPLFVTKESQIPLKLSPFLYVLSLFSFCLTRPQSHAPRRKSIFKLDII